MPGGLNITKKKKQYTPEVIKSELQQVKAFDAFQDREPANQQEAELQSQELISAKKDYLSRMIENSMDANLKLSLKAGRQDAASAGKDAGTIEKAAIPERSSFRQELPKAKGDKKVWQFWKKSESDGINPLKKTYANADLCTLREYNAMTEYGKKGGYQKINVADLNAGGLKKQYNKLVDGVLRKKLKASRFTDKYLSEHITDLYEYTKKTEEINELGMAYPELFAGLSYDRQLELSSRIESAVRMRDVLEAHMYRHGIQIDGNGRVKLRKESANKATRRQDRINEEADYAAKREKFLMSLEYGNVAYEAKALTKLYERNSDGDGFSSASQLKALDDLISSRPEAYAAYGSGITAAYTEIKKALAVRDDAIKELGALLQGYDGLNGEEAEERKRQMKVHTDSCRLAASHIEQYKSCIRFITGDQKEISQETIAFIRKEKQEDLADIIDLRVMSDALEEGLTLKQRMDAGILEMEQKITDLEYEIGLLSKLDMFDPVQFKKDIRTYRSGNRVLLDIHGSTTIEGAQKRYNLILEQKEELEEKLKELKGKTPLEEEIVNEEEKAQRSSRLHQKFIGMGGRYQALKKTVRLQKKYTGMAESRQKDMAGAARAVADNAANGVTYNRKSVADAVLDAFGESKEYDWQTFVKAASLDMGDKVKPELKAELIEKGIRPVLDRMLSFDGGSIDSLAANSSSDLSKQEFWDKYSILKIGSMMWSFKELLFQYGIILKPEETAKLDAFAGAASEMIVRYDKVMLKKNRTALEVLVEDRKVRDDLSKGVFADKNDKYPEIEGWFDKKRGSRGDATYQKALKTITTEYDSFIKSWKDTDKSVRERYETDYESSMARKDEHEVQMKDMLLLKSFFPEAGADVMKRHLKVKGNVRRAESRFSDEQRKAWEERYGKDGNSAVKMRYFSLLLEDAERDGQGNLTTKGKRNSKINERLIADYVSGDEKRVNRAVSNLASKLFGWINRKYSMLKKIVKLDFIERNPEDAYEIWSMVKGFMSVYAEHPDIIESDALDANASNRESCRKYIHRYFHGNSAPLPLFARAYEEYMSSEGVELNNINLNYLNMEDNRSAEDKAATGRELKKGQMEIVKNMYAKGSEYSIPDAYAKREETFTVLRSAETSDKMRTSVQQAYVYQTKIRMGYNSFYSRYHAATEEISKMPDGAEKTERMNKLDEQLAEWGSKLNDANDFLALVTEKLVPAKELSSEDRDLMDRVRSQLDETELHRECEPPYVEEEEEKAPGEKKEEEKAAEEEKEIKKEAGISSEPEENTIVIDGRKQSGRKVQQEAGAGEQLPEYHAHAPLDGEYEQQNMRNCWAVSGAALLNKFAKLNGGVTERVNQNDLRGFVPEIRTKEEIRARGYEIDDDVYDEQLKKINEFIGEGKTKAGSLFEAADFFMNKRNDAVFNRMLINLPSDKIYVGKDDDTGDEWWQEKDEQRKAEDAKKLHNQKAAFLKQVNEVLGTGNLVSLYLEDEGHYVTITTLHGRDVTYWDSSGKVKKTVDIDRIFNTTNRYNRVEISWLSPMKAPEEMLNKYPKLDYDNESGEYKSREPGMEEMMNLAHTKGVHVGLSEKELGENMEGIELSVYLPKKGKKAAAKQ